MQGLTVLYAGTSGVESAVKARFPYASKAFRSRVVKSRLRRVKSLAKEIASLSTPMAKRV